MLLDMSTEIYVAVLVNEITIAGHPDHFEESIVLVRAGSTEEAERAALAHGAAAQTTYANEDGEPVRWAFRELAALAPALEQDLGRLPAEIYARSFTDLDAYHAAEGSPDEARWHPDR